MTNAAWYLARSSGIVAALLAFASLTWGFLFSARETGKRLRPNWWLDLHNYLGGLALVFTAIHIVAVWADHDAKLGLKEIFVPNTARFATWGITWGVLAFYGIAVASLTSMAKVKRKFKLKVWHAIHLVSIPAVVFTAIHAVQTGSDESTWTFRLILVIACGAAIYPALVRLFGLLGVGAGD